MNGAWPLPAGCGELGDLVRNFDWAQTPLGPITGWPQCLIFAVSTVLLSPVPIVLLWGEDGIMIYNDAYSGFAGGRHPQLLGSKVREGWPEVADFNDSVMRVGLAGGMLSYRDQELTLHRYGRPEQVWMNLDYSPVFDASGQPAGVIAIVVESTERVLTERRLRASEALFRTLTEGIPQLIWRAAIDGTCIWSSPQWQAYTGQTDVTSLGWGWLDAVHPDDWATAQAAWRNAAETGHLSYEHRLCNAPENRHCWFQTRATAVRDAEGRIVEWLGTSTDIDDLRQLQERQQVMVAELQHRTRNLLGVVRSIAKQTMAQTGPGETFRERFNDRLSALSRVQGLLSRSDQEPITLRALIETELAALDAPTMQGRIRLAGPMVRLRKATVQTFALALHELATNALKYGAFTPHGRLSVTWRTFPSEDGRRLLVEWVEEGLVREREIQSPVTRGGYGRELIERALPYALKAKTRYELGETALHCAIDLPLPAGEAIGSQA